MWLSLVERYVRDVEVASSNLVTPIYLCMYLNSYRMYYYGAREYGYYLKEELVIPLEKQYKVKRSRKIAYLCVSDRDRWTPVDWTEYDAGHLAFRYVRKGTFMRAATYENGVLCFLTDPFYIDKQSNEICYYPVTIEKQDRKSVV